MALNANNTASAGLAAGQITHYFRTMLAYAKKKLVHAQFADKIQMPRNSGKVVQFRRWIPLDTVTTPLPETTIPDGQTFSEEYITATIYQYGGYVAITDLLEMTHLDARVVELSELMGDQGGRSIDEVVRDKMAETTNFQYANSKTHIYELETTDEFNVTELRLAVRNLEEEDTPYFTNGGSEHYVAIIDEHTKYDLQSDPLWQDVSKYSDKEQIYSGEIGRLFGVRFVRTTLAKKYVNADLSAAGVMLSVATASTTATLTLDQTLTAAEAAALTGRYVNIFDADGATGTAERHSIVAAASGAAGAATITLDATLSSFTAADGDKIYANEYGWNGNTVRATMIFGQHAYAMIDISPRSRNMRILVKQKGTGGTSDPLEQFSTIGWKVEAMAVTLLQPLYIVKVLHGATE